MSIATTHVSTLALPEQLQGKPFLVAPRVALVQQELVCSAWATAGLGVNDFEPVLFRSSLDADSWVFQGSIWPELAPNWSLCPSISRGNYGELLLFGTRTVIDEPGEAFWDVATMAMKPNELVWARSTDGGWTWSDPEVIPVSLYGAAAEAPAPICSTSSGRWIAPFSLFPSIDSSSARPDQAQVRALISDDDGGGWRSVRAINLEPSSSVAGEAWIVQLPSGGLIASCWHAGARGDEMHPNPYAYSGDEGDSWAPTGSLGTMGQSVGLAGAGRPVLVYNDRNSDAPGVRLAIIELDGGKARVVSDSNVWVSPGRPSDRDEGLDDWTGFTFGEPSVLMLSDRTALVTHWTADSGSGKIVMSRVEIDG